jgi:branched-chain amino acid transport system permease protein
MGFQDVVNGLLQGGVYIAVALGLALVFGTLRLMNLAHGAVLIGGGYLAYAVQRYLGIGPVIGVLIVIPTFLVGGFLLQRFYLSRVMSSSSEAVLVATFGVALVLQSVYAQVFTSDTRGLRASYLEGGVDVLGVRAQVIDLVALGFGLVCAAAMHLILTRTRAGAAVRAAAADPETASVIGIDVRRTFAITMGIGCALAASAGMIVVGLGGSLSPAGGLEWLVKSFAVVVLAGVGSVVGIVVAGFALGLVQVFGAQIAGNEYADLVVYGALFLFLAVKPTGLFGEATPA